MSQKQEPAPASPQKTSLVLTSFTVDREKWERFDHVAKAQNRSRGAQIRELIDRELEESGDREQAA